MADTAQIVDTLLSLSTLDSQTQYLSEQATAINDELVDAIQKQAERFLRSDIQRAQSWNSLIHFCYELTQNPIYHGIALLADGHGFSIGLGEYQEALVAYRQAATIFAEQKDPFRQARAEIGQIWPLSCLGEYEQAIDVGIRVEPILHGMEAWYLLAITKMNLGICYYRWGDDTAAMSHYEEADQYCRRVGAQGDRLRPLIQQNIAICLRNLGRFEEAITLCRATMQELNAQGQPVEAARAQQNLAMNYFLLGRYNEALQNLDQVYTIFIDDHRQRDAVLVELFVSECLLQLRRFEEVIEKCRTVRTLFDERGAQSVVGQALMTEAVAHVHLENYEQALTELQNAQTIFSELESQVWVAMTELEKAAVLLQQKNPAESHALAQRASAIFGEHGLVTEEAQAQLIMAEAAYQQGFFAESSQIAQRVAQFSRDKNLPALLYQADSLLGKVAVATHQTEVALQRFDDAIQSLERMRGRLMLEHRANFLGDKETCYEEAVHLSITLAQPMQALAYAERAKSRSLVDLLAYRLDLHVRARTSADEQLVVELGSLRQQRDRLYRRWEGNEEMRLRGWTPSSGDALQQQEILRLEKQITELWHRLLVRNADYASDAALWTARSEPIQPYLAADTLLLEYFVVHGRIVLFLVTKDEISVHSLDVRLADIQRLHQMLYSNLHLTAHSHAERIEKLRGNANALLQQLDQLLLAPAAPQLHGMKKLCIVPHSILHYLPFHAFFDGDSYLIERHEVSYLPGASLLCYLRQPSAGPSYAHPSSAFVYANSWNNLLPATIGEAQTIAGLMGVSPYFNDDIQLATLSTRLEAANLIHLATHGEFRQDNALFSGLAIGNDWLTTLDIFNLRLRASLVTLSGCQTGRSVVRGGDELTGLLRAFLSAGASSLLVSLWSVADAATQQLMSDFYLALSAGERKGVALRDAQVRLVQQANAAHAADRALAHPFFWAPFFLTGDTGTLSP